MDTSTEVSSFSSHPTYGLHPRTASPIDRLGFPRVGAAVLEPTSYRQVVIHAEWQFAMAVELVALERTGTWDLVSLPLCVCPVTCKGSTRLRFALMVPLSVTKLVFVARGFQEEHGIDYNKTICSCEPYDH